MSDERRLTDARRFRSKVVEIEARLFDASVIEQAQALAVGRTALEQWCGGTLLNGLAWKERAIAAESALSSARARIEELERALLRIEGESAKDCSCDAVARAALNPRPSEGSEKR